MDSALGKKQEKAYAHGIQRVKLGPPHSLLIENVGRPNNELNEIYVMESKKACRILKVTNGVYVSCSQLLLCEYVRARRTYCSTYHQSQCLVCDRILTVAEIVLAEGYVNLSCAFSMVSPNAKYTAQNIQESTDGRERLCKNASSISTVGSRTGMH